MNAMLVREWENTAGLAQARLQELFTFDAAAGQLIWRVRPVGDFARVRDANAWNGRYAGTVAGCINGNGYHLIGIDGRKWKAHRLIWIYVNGDIAFGIQIDHINGVRSDNRLANLRLVTNAENQRNASMRRDNASGVVGVSRDKRDRKWTAQIQIDGRKKSLGRFETIKAAAAARAKADRQFGFHEGHGKIQEQPANRCIPGREHQP